jgi:methionine-rich copper-binding protein CopC
VVVLKEKETSRMVRKIIPVVLLAGVLVFSLVGIVLAHAKLITSDPKDGAQLDRPPAKITLVFSEEIDAQQSSFTVTNAQGATVGHGKLDTTDLDHKTLSGALDAGASDGAYTINWVTVTTDDNGKSAGSISFAVGTAQAQLTTTAPTVPQPMATVQPAATAQPAAAVQPTVTPSNVPATGDSTESHTIWLLGASGIAHVLGILTFRRALVHRRR